MSVYTVTKVVLRLLFKLLLNYNKLYNEYPMTCLG